MRSLEEVAIRTLSSLEISGACRESGLTGVWVGGKKACAMGVKISRWMSYHGLALNVRGITSCFPVYSCLALYPSFAPTPHAKCERCQTACAMGVKISRWMSYHGLALNVRGITSCFPVYSCLALYPSFAPTPRAKCERCQTACAMGVKISRWMSYHGLALNVRASRAALHEAPHPTLARVPPLSSTYYPQIQRTQLRFALPNPHLCGAGLGGLRASLCSLGRAPRLHICALFTAAHRHGGIGLQTSRVTSFTPCSHRHRHTARGAQGD
jgi:hypothetical protein